MSCVVFQPDITAAPIQSQYSVARAIIENRDAPPFAFLFLFFFAQGRRISVDHLLSVHSRSGRISWTMYFDLTPTNS